MPNTPYSILIIIAKLMGVGRDNILYVIGLNLLYGKFGTPIQDKV